MYIHTRCFIRYTLPAVAAGSARFAETGLRRRNVPGVTTVPGGHENGLETLTGRLQRHYQSSCTTSAVWNGVDGFFGRRCRAGAGRTARTAPTQSVHKSPRTVSPVAVNLNGPTVPPSTSSTPHRSHFVTVVLAMPQRYNPPGRFGKFRQHRGATQQIITLRFVNLNPQIVFRGGDVFVM